MAAGLVIFSHPPPRQSLARAGSPARRRAGESRCSPPLPRGGFHLPLLFASQRTIRHSPPAAAPARLRRTIPGSTRRAEDVFPRHARAATARSRASCSPGAEYDAAGQAESGRPHQQQRADGHGDKRLRRENPRRLTDTLLRCRCGINESAPSVDHNAPAAGRALQPQIPRPSGAAQTIKPQTGRNASQRDPRPARAQREGCPRGAVRPLPSALRHQPTSSADAKHAVPVVGVGVIAQKEQKIPHGRRFATVVAAAASAASRTGRRR